MEPELVMVPLLSNKESVQRQKAEAERLPNQRLLALAWDAMGLLGERGWPDVRAWLEKGNELQVLTMSPKGAGAAQLIAVGRDEMTERLLESRRVRERAVKDWVSNNPERAGALECREVDWLPGTSLSLYQDLGAKAPRIGFVGMSTPNPNRKTEDKLWIELGAGAPLMSQFEQFGELWAEASRPRTRTVFLSYAHADMAVADHVEAVLRRHDVLVFRDTAHLHSGAPELRALLMHQVARAGVLLILWSAEWEGSLWCRAELAEALRLPPGQGPAVEVLRVGPSRNDAPELSLRGRLFREGQSRAERELAVKLLVQESLAWGKG